MHYPHELIMGRTHAGHRRYHIVRAQEAVIEHNTDENLDLLFKRVNEYLNRDVTGVAPFEDKIIELQATNKSLLNLIRIILRKLLWAARRIKEKENQAYVLTLLEEFRRAADGMEKSVLICKSK